MEEKSNSTPLNSNEKFALKHAPLYSLSEILPLRSVSELRDYCYIRNKTNIKKIKKGSLSIETYKYITDEKSFIDILYLMSDEMLDFFVDLINKKSIEYDEPFSCDILMNILYGYIHIFHHNNKQYLVIPTEIKELYKKIVTNNFLNERAYFKYIEKYAKACANFYNIITYKDLAHIYNSQNEDKINSKDLYNFLSKHYILGKGYLLFESVIAYENNNLKLSDIDDFLKMTKNIPRYIPEKEELLKYQNKEYYENTPEIEALRNYLNEFWNAEVKPVDRFIKDLIFYTRRDKDPKELSKMIEDYNIVIFCDPERRLTDFMEFLLNTIKSIRTPSINGYTINELVENKAKSNITILKSFRRKKKRNYSRFL